jgi:hypothetical protein
VLHMPRGRERERDCACRPSFARDCVTHAAQPFEGREEIRRTPCKHLFHTQCITGWFRVDHTCPMCRSDILKDEDLEVEMTLITSSERPAPSPASP